jgi:hypothetical protein
MKKKLFMTVVALGVFFLASCDNFENTTGQRNPPSNLAFTAEQLKANNAAPGVAAGSFSAEGGNGSLAYSLVPGEDSGRFTVDKNVLKIRETLDEGEYSFRARAVDGEGLLVEESFVLTIDEPDESSDPNPPDGPQDPGDPKVPDLPKVDDPTGPENPENPKDPDLPDAPDPDNPEDPAESDPEEPDISDEPGQGGTPGTPAAPSLPGQGGTPGEGGTNPGETLPNKPARVSGLKSFPGMQLVSLSWNAAARASSYEVRYHTADNFAASKKYAQEPTGTELTIMNLADNTVYYLWVVAKNAGGRSVESNTHTALKTSDPVPAYLLAAITPGGPPAFYSCTNPFPPAGWVGHPAGDYYQIMDRGENYPASERYGFSYGGGAMDGFYQPGIIKFVRQFGNPPDEPSIFLRGDGKTGSDPVLDINRGVIIYQSTNGRFQATYYVDAHFENERHYGTGGTQFRSHPPAAVMGQANGHTSGLGNNQDAGTLEEAVAKFGKQGGPPIGGGGRYDYFTMMLIYYGLNTEGAQ